MRIAICYGNQTVLKELKYQIYSYAEKMRLDIFVDCYNNGEIIISEKIRYDIIFLGYTLCGENGFEIAKKFRKTNQDTEIVFVSAYTDFVFDAFRVRPYRFLVPPVKEQDMHAVLQEFFEKHGAVYHIFIKSGKDTILVNTSKIAYLEADNKHCIIHLKELSLPCNKTMAKIYDILPKSNFIKINRAFIVNKHFITRFNNDMVYLKNGEALHITRNYLKPFKEEFLSLTNCR